MKTIRFVLVVLCSHYGSLDEWDEWTEQIVCDVKASENDILSIASDILIKKGYNLENFDLEVLN